MKYGLQASLVQFPNTLQTNLYCLHLIAHIFDSAGEDILAQIGIVILYFDYLILKVDVNGLDSSHSPQFLLNRTRTGFTLHILDFEFDLFHRRLPPMKRLLITKSSFVLILASSNPGVASMKMQHPRINKRNNTYSGISVNARDKIKSDNHKDHGCLD